MFFHEPGEQRLRSLPARWTDVDGPDAFLALAGGSSCFRTADLLALVAVVRELSARERQADFAGSDKEIMP